MGASRISQTLLIVVLSVSLCIPCAFAENTESLFPSWKERCVEFFHDVVPFRTRRQTEAEIQEAFRKIADELENNDFRVTRDFDQVANRYGALFRNFLNSLGSEDQWIDVGAGAALVQRTYFPKDFLHGVIGGGSYKNSPRLTSVAIRRPAEGRTIGPDGKTLSEFEKETKSPFRYIEGRIQDIDKDLLGKAKLITDNIAARSYDPEFLRQPEALFKLYGNLLVPGGRAYISHQKFWILDKRGKAHPFKEYFHKLKGFRVLKADGVNTILERTREPVSAPAIRLVRIDPVTESTANPPCYYEYVN
jgi:hypothetical protein